MEHDDEVENRDQLAAELKPLAQAMEEAGFVEEDVRHTTAHACLPHPALLPHQSTHACLPCRRLRRARAPLPPHATRAGAGQEPDDAPARER